uniref:Uncharacterized protein n=1 Tax=Wuchereria bancrofti TaxID=6293 RepID=A0AAF5PIT3_WUCBA
MLFQFFFLFFCGCYKKRKRCSLYEKQ